ncbi:YihY family inner membrane protein [Campylobacter fetus]|uniref:YihY family inner membrane protein n=1 Tax=Campylobacter fetus TaxID=196 RepID=UPI0008189BEC|nr:YihY family inner membrane protein [Campylobacter fetus]EAH8299611.1 YihY family inner membrane protein [Campylobacter fetus]EAI7232208.1 YihY family inner membrane protein [Campylobacter fetus]EAJ5690844.1 YihY family inner membrane protein [Campylobacter fetus]EAK0427715.1 YihY family inner membrane protein [Campylobacter fetus]EAK5305062.1 YihY family inner membrane protein [Campylobacter fetus]
MRKIWEKLVLIYKVLEDKQLLHFAASLSFHTLLSIIPVLFISLSIFTQLPSFSGYYAKIKDFIFSNLLPSQSITEYIDQFLSNSSSLGIIGLIVVFFTSIMFFSDYEFVISKLTGAKSRGFWRSLSNYWTLITLMPLGLGMSFWLSNLIQTMLSQSEYTSGINFLTIFPYIIIWAIFAVTYLISINRDFSIKNILISSFASSLAWSISKWIFVGYSFYNKTYSSIYGSFSILLFFFIWIYISWIIFLYGIKLCVALDGLSRDKPVI